MRISIPDKVNNIIDIIQAAGYEAYVVGGCVRDCIIGRIPSDWDITTSASPAQVKRLFPRTIDTGIKHGTVTVMMGKEGVEVTTYRIDGFYEDNRHPCEVTFTADLTEDLKRRDFTINAMAYNNRRGLVDIFDGVGDIERAIIRCVGDPGERFAEDALRMMRAVRFSAQLGYTIDHATQAAIIEHAPDLRAVSAERIQIELMKTITSPHPDYLRVAYETGITLQILPEFDVCMQTEQHNPHHIYSVGEHLLHSMVKINNDPVLRLTMLLHDIAKPLAKTTDADGRDHFYDHQVKGEEIALRILKRLKFDNDTIDKVTKLVRYHDCDIEPGSRSVRRALAKIGADIFPLLLEVMAADIAAQSSYRRQEKRDRLEAKRAIYHDIMAAGDCLSLSDLAITGNDLIMAGLSPGRAMGAVLHALLADVIDHPQHNTKEYLLELWPSILEK